MRPEEPRQLEHPDEDRLCDLVLGYLSPEAESACFAHLRACPECEERARVLVSLHARFRSQARSRVRSHLGLAGVDMERSPEGNADAAAVSLDRRAGRDTGRLSRFSLRALLRPVWLVPLGAAVVLLVLLLPRSGPNALSPGWLADPSRIVVTHRGEGALPSDPRLASGLDAYGRHDAQAAVSDLSVARAPDDLDPVRRAYLANALLWAGRPRDALPLIRSLRVDALPAAIRDEARWTLLVALVKTGQRVPAESLRVVLASRPGPIGERARGAHLGR